VEAVRNNQKVAELRPSGGASASSGASATAIAAAGSLIAIGFGVGRQQSSPRMPGCLLTPRAFLSSLIHPSSMTSILTVFFYFILIFPRIRRFGCTIGTESRSRKLEFWKLTRAS
jgi:hypothetical protein